MRGQGRVFRPEVRGKKTAVWWWDYTARNCACALCQASKAEGRATGRHRESSGLNYPAATKAEAFELMRQRIKERESGAPAGAPGVAAPRLAAFVAKHVGDRRAARKLTDMWITVGERHLASAVETFGAERKLASITVQDVADWVAKLRDQYAPSTVLHYLHAVSGLYARARALKLLPPGFDPVADFMELGDAPEPSDTEARWLEVPDAALLLEAARTYPHERAGTDGGRTVLPFIYPLIATMLLTGGRETEVLGLEVEDISFDRKTITFRPNQWRRLKTKRSARTVRVWPQLEAILRPYVFSTDRPPTRLLFPSPYLRPEGMVTDWRKSLDAVAERGGWKRGEIRSKMFRHTYCAARLQTVDRGQPVSVWTVAQELGHTSTERVERVYGHLGQVRHRSKVVEYRVEQHRAKLKARLSMFAARMANKTKEGRATQSVKSLP